MSGEALPRLQAVAARPGRRLALVVENGPSVVVEFADVIRRGGVFAHLRDRKAFTAVRLGDRRRTIEWPDAAGEGTVDMDVESLLLMAEEQRRALSAPAAE
jgi:hypothetical protein